MLTAVNVRTKFATLVAQFSNAGQRKHLKATAVGKHRAVETIELVQTAGTFQNVESRTQIQVVGVAQNDFGINLVFYFV